MFCIHHKLCIPSASCNDRSHGIQQDLLESVWQSCSYGCCTKTTYGAMTDRNGGAGSMDTSSLCACLTSDPPYTSSRTTVLRSPFGTDTSAGRGTRSMVILIPWEIWHERNNCTFTERSCRPKAMSLARNVEKCGLACAKCMEGLFGDIA